MGSSEAFHHIDITAASYIVIVTHDHGQDINVLNLAIGKPCAYIDMIGSRKKREDIYHING